MHSSLRKSFAWLRGRWHSDLEFQHGAQREVLLERLQAVLSCLEGQASRLDLLNDRLTSLESRADAMSAEQAARWSDLRELLMAASRDVVAHVQAAAGDVSASVLASNEDLRARLGDTRSQLAEQLSAQHSLLVGAEPRTREAIAEIGAVMRDAEARHEQRSAAAAQQMSQQAAEFAGALHSIGQTVQALTQAAPALSQEIHVSRQHTTEQHARLEQSLQQHLAAQRETVEREEQTRRETAARPAKLSAEELRAIERQGVFVVGSARSGTTILSDCFNASRDVYMLQEACFFCSEQSAKFVGREKYDFAAEFNNRHVSYGNPRDKGTYVPTAETPDRTPLEFMNRMRDRYRYVGEKLAFGPEPHYMGEHWESDFLAYHARYFYHSHYFITIRAPHEALWSMHKMFPDRPIAGLFEAWLRTLRTVLELYLAFPNTHLLVLEWLDERMVSRFADVLQTEIALPPGMLGREYQHSALGKNELVPALRPYRAWHDECAAFYREVRDSFSPETLQYTKAAHRRRFVVQMGKRATALLDEVMRSMQTRTLAMRRAA